MGHATSELGDALASDFWTWFDGERETAPIEHRSMTAHEAYLAIYGRPVSGAAERRSPTARDRRIAFRKQDGKCLYCDERIGNFVDRRGKAVRLRPNFDHFIPFAYSAANRSSNWVLACHLCNAIKTCKVFDTVGEAQRYVQARRVELGIRLLGSDVQRQLQLIEES